MTAMTQDDTPDIPSRFTHVSTATTSVRPVRAAGQAAALRKLRRAMAPADDGARVVLVRAHGGMGKTRLLEEALARVNHPNTDWRKPGVKPWPEFTGQSAPIILDLIDVIDTRLHDRSRFIAELYKRLHFDYKVEFPRYRDEEERLRELSAGSSNGKRLEKTKRNAADAFLDELRELTEGNGGEGRRVVLLIDTVERLSYEMLDQLLEPDETGQSLLREKDLIGRTPVWLIHMLRVCRRNMTVVLAGRSEEGESFFNRVRDACVALEELKQGEITLDRLLPDETAQFFANLRDDAREAARHAANEEEEKRYEETAHQFSEMLRRAERLYYYTGGVPVRLSLYAHIIGEGVRIPHLLQMEPKRALALAPAPATTDEARLKWVRWRIEDAFINLIFRNEDDLRSQILLNLVRAPRGLTAEQLCFVIDAPDDADPAVWRPKREQLERVLAVLREIETHTYLGKRRSSWDEFAPFLGDVEPIGAATHRVGLQDEIYDVFAEHMGLLADPVSPEMEPIISLLTPQEEQMCRERHLLEQEARGKLYRKLSRWAGWRHETLRARKRELLIAEEKEFERELRLHNPRTYAFARLTEREIRERAILNMAITQFEIERMVYDLLNSAEWSLNTAYITLEDDNDRSAREEADFWAQAEMWRTLYDNHLMKFVSLDRRDEAYVRGDQPIDILRRVAEQENVTRCIKRFILRGNYNRAIKFAEAVERRLADRDGFKSLSMEGVVRTTPARKGARSEAQVVRSWESWRHTVAYGERLIWCNVARIRRGRGTAEAIEEIRRILPALEACYESDRLTELPPFRGDRVEYGFRAVEGVGETDPNYYDHPGRVRLKRLISHAHTNVAHGYRLIGRMQKAADHYAVALEYIRTEKDQRRRSKITDGRGGRGLVPAYRATVLNGAARAHSEMGIPATEMCLDGLALRRDVAEEVPLASSFNMLAVLYDDMGRYEDAPLLSAKSIAYCRRARETRQLGYSLLQMAESLRHLADRVETMQRLAVSREDYFDAAEGLLYRARRAFRRLGDTDRLAEVNVEIGSLFRDRMEIHVGQMRRLRKAGRQPQPDVNFQAYSRQAGETLDAALGSIDPDRPHIWADAAINRARVCYLDYRYQVLLDGGDSAPEVAAAHRDYRQALEKAEGFLLALPIDPDNPSAPQLGSIEGELLSFDAAPAGMSRRTMRDRAWAFRQLSLVQLIRATEAMDDFEIAIARLKAEDTSPEKTQYAARAATDGPTLAAIGQAAEAYGRAVRFAERFSRFSRAIISVRNHFYRRARKLNREEMALLRAALDRAAGVVAPAETFESLARTLTEFFGHEARESIDWGPAE